jgi:O-antigen/teichoic acid export membrane protein
VIAPDLVLLTIGAKWRESIPLIQILVAYGLIRTIALAADDVLKTTGNVKVHNRLVWLQGITLLALLYPAIELGGLEGAAVALVVSASLRYLGHLVVVVRRVGVRRASVVGPVVRYGALAGVMGWTVLSTRAYFAITTVFHLAGLVLVGAFAYLLLLGLFDRDFVYKVYRMSGVGE